MNSKRRYGNGSVHGDAIYTLPCYHSIADWDMISYISHLDVGWLTLLILLERQCEGLKVGISNRVQIPTSFHFIKGRLPGNFIRRKPNTNQIMLHSKFLRAISLAVIASIAGQSYGQGNDKWHGSIEFNPLFHTYKGATPGFDINLTATRNINDYIALGFGVGITESFKFEGAPGIPLFARVHAEDYSKNWTPFFDFDFGYSINTNDFGSGSLIFNPTVGIRYGAFGIGVGYYGSKVLKDGYDMAHAVNVRLAYYFGYHKSNSQFARALRKLEFGIDLGARFPIGGSKKESYEHEVSTYGNVWAHNTTSAHGRYTTGGDINLSLLYPVNDQLSLGIMAGIGAIGMKSTTKFKLEQTELWTQHNPHKSLNETDKVEDSDIRTMIPIALRGKYRFRQIKIANKFYPFASMDIGMALNPDNSSEEYSAFYWSPTVGLALDVAGGKHSLELGVSYVPQCVDTFDYNLIQNNAYFGSYCKYHEIYNYKSQTIGSLRIALGYTF